VPVHKGHKSFGHGKPVLACLKYRGQCGVSLGIHVVLSRSERSSALTTIFPHIAGHLRRAHNAERRRARIPRPPSR